MQRRVAAWLIGIAAMAGACARAAQTSAPATVDQPLSPLAECHATVRDMDVSTWRAVSAETFTFCVPPDWRGSGRSWRRGSGEISWGTGTHPREQVATVIATVPASDRATLSSGPLPDSDVRPFSEEIGGRRAEMWRNRIGQDYHTGADWEAMRIWMVGKARDATTADLQLAIFRTVRFQGP